MDRGNNCVLCHCKIHPCLTGWQVLMTSPGHNSGITRNWMFHQNWSKKNWRKPEQEAGGGRITFWDYRQGGESWELWTILAQNLQVSVKRLKMKRIFSTTTLSIPPNQQKNARWLVSEWPSPSPELNPVENLWGHLKWAMTSLTNMEHFCKEKWAKGSKAGPLSF